MKRRIVAAFIAVVSVVGVVTAVDASTSTPAGGLNLMTPCRLADTRWAPGFGDAGDYTWPAPGRDRRYVQIGLDECPVPSNAKAVAVRVTVTSNGSTIGFVAAWSGVGSLPNASITNLPRTRSGDTVSTPVTVQLAPGGTFTLFLSGGDWRNSSTNAVVDVEGWYR
jgi:hypothetical protein